MNKHIVPVIILCLMVMGCSFGKKEEENKEMPPVESVPRFVEYEIISINENIGPCANDSTSKKCLVFQIEYPRLKKGASSEIIEKLNDRIRSDISDTYFISEKPISFEELKDNLGNDYKAMISDFPEYENQWFLEVNSDILYQDSLFISVASTVYSFTGGAHPNSAQIYRSYDLRTGEPITLDDILIEGYEKSLNEVAEIEFRMTKEIPPNESLKERGYWFEEGKFALNENFAIINKSLIFYFDPYEIAPYALGPTELELKLTDFVSLIKEGGVIESYRSN